MKKALIIGGAGFVGGYLAGYMLGCCKWSVAMTKMPGQDTGIEGVEGYDLDILDGQAVEQLVARLRPDYLFHLAAQSSVALSWKNPGLTADVNIKGCIHVLEAIRKLECRPRILLIGSSEEYGAPRPEDLPVGEEAPLKPGNIYAATKACQGMLGSIYHKAYGMEVMMVRAFNHVGPTQAPVFVVADFCRQVARIEKGLQEPVIRVGNLSAKRDFTDVRDVVRAYVMLVEKGRPGQTYNVGSGCSTAIQEILGQILSLAQVPIKVETDPAKLRPVDVPVVEADVGKLQACTGWRPEIPLSRTLEESLDYWRKATG